MPPKKSKSNNKKPIEKGAAYYRRKNAHLNGMIEENKYKISFLNVFFESNIVVFF